MGQLPREAALRAFRAVAREPVVAVSYRSAGRLLIIGGDDTPAADALARLGGDLSCLRLIPVPPGTPGGVDHGPVPTVRAAEVSIEGHLGAFRLTVPTAAGPVGLGDLLTGAGDAVDLVLDLGVPPLLHREVPPPGYFAPGADPKALESALAQLPGLVGELEKPRYFRYDPDVCAHARSGIVACRRCIDACPARAITELGDGVAVDASLCQGLGVCATTCPTGAIRYADPRPGETLDGLRALLRAFREAGGGAPVLLLHGRESGGPALEALGQDLPGHVVPVELEEVGSAGLEVWLSALAYGAAAVRLLAPPSTPPSARRVLEDQVGLAAVLLGGMGYPEDGVALVPDLAAARLPGPAATPLAEPAGFAGLDDKRTVLRLALDHLHGHAPARRPLISLPAGAPFGEVWLDGTRCTLCMACVGQCPGKALLGGDETPQLRFIEDNCVQCGLCGRSCPENAIGPSPRYLFDAVRRRAPRVLKEEPPFHCIRCGKPFGTRSMIDRMTARLAGHALFRGPALERLQMCEDCRVRALYEAELAAQATPGDDGRDR
jgi:ferredoxin